MKRRILVDSLSLAGAVGVVGASFGVLARAAGLSVAKACALSLLVFTGASQFAAVAAVAAGGSAAAILGGALLLGVRNGLYAASLRHLRLRPRLLAAHLTIDETTGMAVAQPEPEHARFAFWATGIALFACWNAGTLAGALAGNVLPDPETLGLDAAFPAAFAVLLAPLLRDPAARRAAVAGALIALAALPFVPAGIPVLIAALGVAAGLRR